MKATEILSFWQAHDLTLADDEGFRFGNPQVEVTGIMVAWMGTLDVIRTAHAQHCNLLILHEDLLFPPGYTRAPAEKHLSGVVNTHRLTLLSRWEMTVFRAHGSLDRLCILDDFASVLGLAGPAVREGFFRVYDISPLAVRELADRVKEHLGLDQVRAAGDPDQVVRRVGLPWGGLGLSLNAAFLEGLFRHNVDVLIAGESDEYAMWAAQDAGIPLIETSHTVSEDPGLRHAADMLGEFFPEVPVKFYELGRPWRVL